ncbi:MAG: HU family DNA-binding protein [Acidobacteriota bacterium]
MNAKSSPVEFELDEQTDDLLQRIADSGDKIEPELLREIIPSRQELVRYLEQHRLTDDPIAQSILAQYDAIAEPAAKHDDLKSALAKALSVRLNLPPATTAALIDVLAQTAIAEIKKHGEFLIPGVGRLVKVMRPARTGRNPQTGETIEIEPQLTVKFRPLKGMKEGVAESEESESGLEA